MITQDTSGINTKAPGKALNIVLWVLQVALAGMFIMAGFGKLSGVPQMVANFNRLVAIRKRV